ncbi:MAG TPA: 2-amino-4-hydroxy-6-hydroxymethyldihydropteridine diphosphokinase [Hyphomicrobiaceae bacterium]|nr:2-amino-4-hydroxy-6-hydroxymethyldihydropteridine diphosphokinase [Hyphomicrobiaceae bacterium]
MATLILLGIGANADGAWGAPPNTLLRAREALAAAGLDIIASSPAYVTEALGPGRQRPHLNAVLAARSNLPPGALLRLAKRIERQAGRRLGRRWGPRALDIDLLDMRGKRYGWPPCRRYPGRLILPHPEMHRRAFVLVPLLDVAPSWRHPVLDLAGRTLLARLPARHRRGVGRSLDFVASACDKP